MAPVGVACHAFGREGDCRLCELIDLDHPASAATLGRWDAGEPLGAGEAAFWAHLARRSDGGPSDAAELAEWNRRRRDKWDRDTDRRVRVAIAEQSDLPSDAPF